MSDSPKTPRPTYVIVLREAVIAQDIALTIADFDPCAGVIVAHSAEAAAVALFDVGQVAVAFVSEAPSRFVHTALAAEIARRGGRVVLMGEEAEDTGASAKWGVLALPFDTETVIRFLG